MDHSRVLLWFQVTAIIEWFHATDSLRRISDKPIASDVNLTFKCGLHHRLHQTRLTVTAPDQWVLSSTVVLDGHLLNALALRD